MFLLDDSVFAPEDTGTNDDELNKTQALKYPNGRCITISSKANNKYIFEDKPLTKGFKNLGNIDLFNPIDFNELTGKSEIDDIIPIQDRINGALLKIRELVAFHVKQVCLDKGLDVDIQEGDLVNSPVLFLDSIGREDRKSVV